MAQNSKKVGKPNRKEVARQKREAKIRQQRLRWIGIAMIPILFVAAMVAVGVSRQANTPDPADLDVIADQNIDGSLDAPVIVVEYGDFNCPACRQWHRSGIKSQIQQRFGDQVTFVFRHFPVISPQSPKAAEASQCAAEQDQFWPYHDYLYEEANGLSVDQLKSYASAIGLNQSQFDSCLDEGRYEAYVETEERVAIQAGAPGTPSFTINGQLVANPSFNVLANAIDAALEN